MAGTASSGQNGKRPLNSSVLLLVPEEGTAAEKLSAVIDALQKVAVAQQNASDTAAKGPSHPPAPLNNMPATSVAFRSKGQRLLIGVSDKERGFINFVETQLERLYRSGNKNHDAETVK